MSEKRSKRICPEICVVVNAVILCLLMFPTGVMAQDPASTATDVHKLPADLPDPHEAQPERPTVATHAGTVAPGWIEIEAGTEFDRYSERYSGGSFPILFKIGVASKFQLNIQTPVIRSAGNSASIGDSSLGMKWRVVEHARVFGDMAILPSVKFPSGSINSGSGTGTTDFNLLLISSNEFRSIDMDLNAGYTRRSGDGANAPRNATLWTASFGGTAHGRVGWVAELYGYPGTSGAIGAPPIVAFLGGPTLQLRKFLVLDSGVIAPIEGPQPRAFYAGMVYNVGRLRKQKH